MESDKNFMPDVKVGLRDVLDAVKGVLYHLPEKGYRGRQYRGASEMLDTMSLSINEPTDGEACEGQQAYQPELDFGGTTEVAPAVVEHVIGHQVLEMTMTAQQGFDALGDYHYGSI